MSQSGSFGVNPTRVWTEAQFASTPPAALMDRGSNKDGQWLFVQAAGAIAKYAFVTYSSVGQAAEATTTTYATASGLGVAQVALADNEYGWIWIGCGGGIGSGIKGLVAASFAAGGILNTTATAGVADDAATKVIGGAGLTLDSGSGSAIELYASGFLGRYTN
jgi:hypothetical protein